MTTVAPHAMRLPSAQVIVVSRDASKMFGESDPVFVASVVGLIGDDAIEYSLAREAGENVGEYAITPSGEEKQGNYLVTFMGATFTVNPKSIEGAEVELAEAGYTYDGSAKEPAVKSVGGAKLVAGTDFEVSYSANTNAGTATAVVVGKGNYTGKASAAFAINPASIKGAKLKLSKTDFVYSGKVQKPTVKAVGGKALKAGVDYGLKCSNAKSAKVGSYTVWAVGKGNYAGTSAKAGYAIAKLANPAKVKAKAPSVKLAKARKAKQAIAAKSAFSVSGNKGGKVTYKKASGDKAVSAAPNGKVTIAKGAKKGAHSVKVKVSIAAKGSYAAFSKTVTLKVTVK